MTKRITTAQALAEIEAARNANRDSWGRICNKALDRRLQAREREILISALGLAPEGSNPGERYASSTGELRARLAEI